MDIPRRAQHMAVVLGLALAGCGGGAGGTGGATDLTQSNQFCHTIPPVSSGCSPCANTNNPVLAFDANLATYSEMSPGGQSSFRGRSSAVQPAGSMAGVYFVLPNPAGVTISITTYLDGTQQEVSEPLSRQTPSDNCSGSAVQCEFHDGGESWVGMGTTLDYDEIQAVVSNTGAGDILVYELCVR